MRKAREQNAVFCPGMRGNASLSEHDFRDLRMYRMVLYPVNRFILKIVFKMRARACRVLRAGGVFLCGFASEKNSTQGRHTAFVPLHDTLPRTGH